MNKGKHAWPPRLPLVAILRGIQPFEAAEHARALLDAGFDCIEVPTNSPGWAASVATIVQLAPQALVGAGTVLDLGHLDALQAAGGAMAVSPHTHPALVAEAVRRGLVALPGAMTPSEVFAAVQAGVHAVKLFPAASLGVAHVKALRAVLPPGLALLAVGGVTPHNLAQYLHAGCTGAGLGSELYRAGQAAPTTARNAADFIAAWRAAQTP
jgi:2-dehydro-3-deoxyphosphogalactonate aldolase